MTPRYTFTTIAVAVTLTAVCNNPLTPAQKASIATRFASEVKYNFAGYGNFGQDFDSICRALLPELASTPSDEEFGKAIILLANRLKDGHTSIGWNADVAMPPFLQKRIGDRVYVTEVFSDEYRAKGIGRGTEILEIDHMPVIEYGIRNVLPYIPSSTPQWAEAFAFGSNNLTKGKRGTPITITFRNRDGNPFSITDQRDSPWDIIKPNLSVSFDSLPGNIGLLKIPSFRAYNFNAEKFSILFEQQIMPTSALIIDIRDNNGGNSQVGDFIMQFFATDTIPQGAWETPEYQAAYASWGKPWHTESVDMPPLLPHYMQYPELSPYDKPVILLINSATFSAAENFAVLFKNAGRGKIIGTPSGGSSGNPIMIDLGWGYHAMICTRKEKLADGTEFIGIGIIPDIIVEETESVLSGNDNVIEAAVKELQRMIR